MKVDDDMPYREGVVVDRPVKKGSGSFVNVGMRKEVQIDKSIKPGVRVTVKMEDTSGVYDKCSSLRLIQIGKCLVSSVFWLKQLNTCKNQLSLLPNGVHTGGSMSTELNVLSSLFAIHSEQCTFTQKYPASLSTCSLTK